MALRRRRRQSSVEAKGEELEGRDALGWLLLLRHVGVFEALNEQHLRRVAKLFTIERYADGDTVVLAGARGDSLHIVLNGRARVRTPGGHTRALGADDCFGELALIDGAPRSATVTAVGELTTAKLTQVRPSASCSRPSPASPSASSTASSASSATCRGAAAPVA